MLQPIKEDLHLSDTVLGLLSGFAFSLCYATAALPIARLADRFDRRLIISIGLGFWSLVTALHAVTRSAWQLATCGSCWAPARPRAWRPPPRSWRTCSDLVCGRSRSAS